MIGGLIHHDTPVLQGLVGAVRSLVAATKCAIEDLRQEFRAILVPHPPFYQLEKTHVSYRGYRAGLKIKLYSYGDHKGEIKYYEH